MHSSRMCTGRSLTICLGGCLLRGVCSQGGASSLGVCSWGVPPLGGHLLLGGSAPRGGLPGGLGGIPACTGADPPYGQNHRHE